MEPVDQKPKGACHSGGLNDSIRCMGRELHVQTEDLGGRDRFIRTQVFCEGRVLLTARIEYPDPTEGNHDLKQVTEIMRRQHFSVIREIEDRLRERR